MGEWRGSLWVARLIMGSDAIHQMYPLAYELNMTYAIFMHCMFINCDQASKASIHNIGMLIILLQS